MIDTLAILAPGLLGGSVARAARAHGAAERIVIWARRAEVRQTLADQPWCDEVAETAESAVKAASVAVIAAPVTRIKELIDRIAPHLAAGAIVTDVGSVKAEICRHGEARLAASDATFIGSHPMAGSERTGWAHGNEDLFVDRTCFVTPGTDVEDTAIATIERFWQDLGSKVVTIPADRHDEIVGHISHLPQVIATNLGILLAQRPAEWSQFAGSGLKDTTRIAAGDVTMWMDILAQNRDEILRALAGYENSLHQFHTALADRNWTELRTRFESGKSWRDSLRP